MGDRVRLDELAGILERGKGTEGFPRNLGDPVCDQPRNSQWYRA